MSSCSCAASTPLMSRSGVGECVVVMKPRQPTLSKRPTAQIQFNTSLTMRFHIKSRPCSIAAELKTPAIEIVARAGEAPRGSIPDHRRRAAELAADVLQHGVDGVGDGARAAPGKQQPNGARI